ncbi:MAG: hypothetical protein IKG14_05890 [Clostridia bacterium]|nr:hypothetical protein [Clostridia bacterium]
MEKSCIFYASKYHLSLILLEYLKNKNTKQYTVNTFLENGIEEEIKKLKKKYNIISNDIYEINFKKTKTILDKTIELNTNTIFIVGGDNNYIKEANTYIKNKIFNCHTKKIEIINCFNYKQRKEYIDKILKENNKILYTTGSKQLTN